MMQINLLNTCIMELKEQIAELTETINDLKRLIAETEEAISAGNSPVAILEERRGELCLYSI